MKNNKIKYVNYRGKDEIYNNNRQYKNNQISMNDFHKDYIYRK